MSEMKLIHWPECTNAPCTCGDRGDLLFSNRIVIQRLAGLEPLTAKSLGTWPIVDISLADFKKQYE